MDFLNIFISVPNSAHSSKNSVEFFAKTPPLCPTYSTDAANVPREVALRLIHGRMKLLKHLEYKCGIPALAGIPHFKITIKESHDQEFFLVISLAASLADLTLITYMTAIRITRPISRDRKRFLVRPATI